MKFSIFVSHCRKSRGKNVATQAMLSIYVEGGGQLLSNNMGIEMQSNRSIKANKQFCNEAEHEHICGKLQFDTDLSPSLTSNTRRRLKMLFLLLFLRAVSPCDKEFCSCRSSRVVDSICREKKITIIYIFSALIFSQPL